jgi:hypothetical protein
MEHLGFTSCKADPDVWIRENNGHTGAEFVKYVLIYTWQTKDSFQTEDDHSTDPRQPSPNTALVSVTVSFSDQEWQENYGHFTTGIIIQGTFIHPVVADLLEYPTVFFDYACW